jgi:hypothetical protein
MNGRSSEPLALEFIIVGVAQSGKERLTLIGRNGDASVRLGDTFDSLIRYKRRKFPEEMGDESVKLAEMPVSLRVVDIQAYGRQMQSLGQGMTGSLAVEGEGIGSMAPGWVLACGTPAALARNGVKTVPASEGVVE